MESSSDEGIAKSKEPFDGSTFQVNALLVNPLQGKKLEEMDTAIKDFMAVTKLERVWTDHIRKGAFLAQDARAFKGEREDGLELEDDERRDLEDELSQMWNQPFLLYALVFCCSLGAATQGWDEVGASYEPTREC